MRGSILIIDGDRDAAEALESELRRRGSDVEVCHSAADGVDRLFAANLDLVLVASQLPGLDASELCQKVVQVRPELPIIVMIPPNRPDAALLAIRAGAWDVLHKPWDVETLGWAVERAVQHRLMFDELERLRRVLRHTSAVEDIQGESQEIRRVYELVGRVAESDTTVLLTGETGVGKRITARMLHSRSRRASGPFMELQCASLAEPQLELELFGQARTLYTNPRTARVGLFSRAEQGTLFLEEVGELPQGIQVRLLRALQERHYRPVGGDVDVPFDVRVIASSTQDLPSLVRTGRFREDLYYRLNVLSIDLPPLRARGKDVLVLAHHFVQQLSSRMGKAVVGVSPAAAERLLAWHWPGNVRELRDCIERSIALARGELIGVEDLPEKIRNYRGWQVLTSRATLEELVPMSELERRYILHVLEVVGGSRTLAARTLGVDRKTLYRRLEQYGIPPEHPRRTPGTPRPDENLEPLRPGASSGSGTR